MDIPRSVEIQDIDAKIYSDFVSVRVKGMLTQIKLWEEVFENPKKL